MFMFLSALLKQPCCSYQVSQSMGEKDSNKGLKARQIFLPEHFKKSSACFIEQQKILHSIIKGKYSWG